MQYITYAGVALALVLTGSVMAQQDKAKNGTSTPAPSATVSGDVKVPSEEEIKAFVTEYKESAESKTTEMLNARFYVPRLTPEQQKKYVDAKTAPFQLTIDLYKMQVADGQKKYVGRVDKGTACFAILNEEGKVVKAMSDDLIKLCSSWGGTSGYLGEVAQSGKYKAIVWIKKPNGTTLGTVMELKLTTP